MTGLFPTAYFGSVAYFQFLLRYPDVVIEAYDHFPKQTFRNRCTISVPQGSHRLTVPVERPNGSKTLSKDICVSYKQDWRKDHWRALQSAYASAPYFEHYEREIRELIYAPADGLLAFNLHLTQTVLGLFDTAAAFRFTEEYVPLEGSEADLRSTDFDDSALEGFTVYPYQQVYFGQADFAPNRSILDLLFCEGPIGRKQLGF